MVDLPKRLFRKKQTDMATRLDNGEELALPKNAKGEKQKSELGGKKTKNLESQKRQS